MHVAAEVLALPEVEIRELLREEVGGPAAFLLSLPAGHIYGISRPNAGGCFAVLCAGAISVRRVEMSKKCNYAWLEAGNEDSLRAGPEGAQVALLQFPAPEWVPPRIRASR